MNITHESVAGTTRNKVNTAWKIHVRAGCGGGESERWFQIQDLIVEEVRKEMIFLGETVIQVIPTFQPLNPYFNRINCLDMGEARTNACWVKWSKGSLNDIEQNQMK